MATGKFIAYLRVSTAKQGASGLGLMAQRAAIMAYLDGGDWTLLGEHVEVESGKHDDRPALKAALQQCRLTGASLIIAKLDRLSRRVSFLSALMDSGVEFVAVDIPHASRFTLHILAAVAEHEASMISVRTKAALAAAKARGVILGGFKGGPKVSSKAGTATLVAKADMFATGVGPTAQALQAEGLSLHGIAKALMARGIKTATGREVWHASTVRNLLARIAA